MKKYILAYADPSSGLSLESYDNERDFTSDYLHQRIGIEPSSKAKEDLEQCEFPEQAEALRLFHESRYQEAIDAASELDPTDYDYPEIATEEIEIHDPYDPNPPHHYLNYPIADWIDDVRNGYTRRGYEDWVRTASESNTDPCDPICENPRPSAVNS